jgi:hypothetical protein
LGNILIIFPKSVMLDIFYPKFLRVGKWVTKWLKATFEGDKCQVEGMQYILLALVYFGGIMALLSIIGEGGFMLQALVSRRGSDCMENMIITLSAQRSL